MNKIAQASKGAKIRAVPILKHIRHACTSVKGHSVYTCAQRTSVVPSTLMLFLPVRINIERNFSCTLFLGNIMRDGFCLNQVFSIYLQDGRTPLVLASNNGRNEVIHLLLNHGAKVDFPNTVSKQQTVCEQTNYLAVSLAHL